MALGNSETERHNSYIENFRKVSNCYNNINTCINSSHNTSLLEIPKNDKLSFGTSELGILCI